MKYTCREITAQYYTLLAAGVVVVCIYYGIRSPNKVKQLFRDAGLYTWNNRYFIIKPKKTMKQKSIYIIKFVIKHDGWYQTFNAPEQFDSTRTHIDCQILDTDYSTHDIVNIIKSNWQFRGIESIEIHYSDKSKYYFELKKLPS